MSKGQGHFLIWNCWGICWILCSMLMLRHPQRMEKAGKAIQKQLKAWFLALEILTCYERLKKLLQVFSSLSKRRLRSNLTEMYNHQYHKKILMLVFHLGKKLQQKGRHIDKVPARIDNLFPSCYEEAVCSLLQVRVYPSYSGRQASLINHLAIIVVCCR